MKSSNQKDRLNQELQTHLGKNRERDYDSAVVLLLYWEEGDPCFKDEAGSLEDLCRQKFGYPVFHYQIPSKDSQLSLLKRIADLAEQSNSTRSLSVVHYGGHGDEDIENNRRKGVWAAKDQGGPTLLWSDIQPTLGLAQGDVLLILDCCYAAQSSRDRDRVVPPNVEMMAACAMNRQTHRPGPRSFTTIWIGVVTELLKEGKPVIIRDVTHRLANARNNLPESPIYLPLGRDGSIRLEQSSNTSVTGIYSSHEASLSLQMMLRSPLNEDLFRKVIHWLGKSAPRDVTGIDVLDLTERATHLERFIMKDTRSPSQTPSAVNVPPSYYSELRNAWDVFLTRLEGTLVTSISVLKADWHSSQNSGQQKDRLNAFLQEFGANVSELQRTVERVVLCLPTLHSEESLRQKLEDPDITGIGVNKSLEVRFQTLTLSTQSTFLDLKQIFGTPHTNDSLSGVSLEEDPRLGSVIIEHATYERNDALFNEKLIRDRMDRLANVLKTASTGEFRTPECMGCASDETGAKYGLVFKNPFANSANLLSLYTIIGRHAEKKRDPHPPTLGQRFKLALALGQALLKWHCVGWVHQGIASYNIFFFEDVKTKKVDYSKPYLYGFCHSREEDGSSSRRPDPNQEIRDIYRHPDRQGWPPIKKHQKMHDIYSFGLLLLEIGLWEQLPLRFDHLIKRVGRAALGRYLLQRSEGLLSIGMGLEYESATRACLSGDFGIIKDDIHQSEFARAFESQVLTKITHGIRVDGELSLAPR